VVDATNVGIPINGALVAVVGTAVNALSNAQGALTLSGLPAGTVTLDVSFPSTGAYRAMQVPVATVADAVTQVSIAAVPTVTTPPNYVLLNPADETIDVGGQIQFDVDVRTFGVPVTVMPSLSLIGDIGTLLPSGLFVATKVGTGQVTAHVEGLTDTSTVEVVAPRAPRLGTLSVSPTALPADGGEVRIAVTATDGDGVQTVIAEVEQPNRALAYLPLMLEAGNSLDGSWGASYFAAANSNPASPSGVQLEQTYSVRVTARDNSAMTAQSQWVDFTVAGLESPPPPPD
jgi:hypothetical protein